MFLLENIGCAVTFLYTGRYHSIDVYISICLFVFIICHYYVMMNKVVYILCLILPL